MAQTVALLLGVHAHQPVGNFTNVLDDAHARCYGPYLRVLYEYPDFHFAIHISGWLLDYLMQHFPEDMLLLKEMVKRGQAELFGAGYTEPVLAAIPSVDRIGQVTQLSKHLKKTLGQTPKGAWLTERVWEATVVPALADSNIEYVTVDDYHFMCTGKSPDSLKGFYTTEEDGRQLDLYPISEALRYRIPFSPAHEVVTYLESLADESGQAAAIYFDDIEKFGIWPETYHWVYEMGWLRSFIEGVLNSSIIKSMRYMDYHAEAKTRGVVYLPTTSYIEMNEWTLPAKSAHQYADLIQQQRQNGQYELTKPFVRGGIWRNFFMRYPESNWMHKRMLAISARYHALSESKKTSEMLVLLYESQANDAYWHGLFGGLYLPHLRRAIYAAILKLEGLLDIADSRPMKVISDIDLDGYDEISIHNDLLQIIVKADTAAAIEEFDSYLLAHNFGDSLARSPEHYHRKVGADYQNNHQTDGIANPYERSNSKHHITVTDLATDQVSRSLFRDAWIASGGELFTPVHYNAPSKVAGAAVSFEGHFDTINVNKKYTLKDNKLHTHYHFNGDTSGVFRVELNLAMPSCDGPTGRFRIGDEILGGFGQPLHFAALKDIWLEDEVLGGALHISLNTPACLHAEPHFTVSQSEAGFEKIMQAVTLVLTWQMKQIGKTITIDIAVS